MAKTEVVEMLAGVPIFSGLSKRELREVAGSAKEVTHKAGDVLAKEGNAGVGFFLILEGTARVSVGGRPRKKLGAGDFFGEISLLDQGPRTATVVAETDMRMLGLTQWVFKRLVEQTPSIGAKMLKVMAQRLRASSTSVTT